MRICKIIILLLWLCGCSLDMNMTIQDEKKAAEISAGILRGMMYKGECAKIYDESSTQLHQKIKKEEYLKFCNEFNEYIGEEKFSLNGYETYGTEDAITVYGESNSSEKKLFVKITLIGSMTSGCKLFGLFVQDISYEHNSEYKKYPDGSTTKI